MVAAWTAKTSFKRSDFGISWNVPMENGLFYVGDEIIVEITIEAARPSEWSFRAQAGVVARRQRMYRSSP